METFTFFKLRVVRWRRRGEGVHVVPRLLCAGVGVREKLRGRTVPEGIE